MNTSPRYHSWKIDDLASAKVSESSYWNDDVWRFPVITAGQRINGSFVNWRMRLPDGSLLTDPRHAPLLEAWKRVLWGAYAHPGDGVQRKPAMFIKTAMSARYLSCWLLRRGFTDLTQLTPEVAGDYLDDLVADKMLARKSQSAGISSHALMPYVHILEDIWCVRHELVAAGLPLMKKHPLGDLPSYVVCKQLGNRAIVSSIPALADDAFNLIVRAAWEYLEANAETLIAANNHVANYRNTNIFSRNLIGKQANQVARSVEPGLTVCGLKHRIADLRTACAIVIQATTGMRISELLGLETNGSLHEKQLPDCVEVKRSDDDYYELLFIRGWQFKGVSFREEARWVAGLRPTANPYVSPPVRSAEILAALDDGWRRYSGVNKLYIAFGNPGAGFPIDRSHVTGNLGSRALTDQKKWAKEKCGFTGDFSTQRWRKTFAQYMVRTAPNMLPAISDHFKHLSHAVTEQAYVRCKAGNKELSELITAERARFAAAVIHEMATGERAVVGPKAEWLHQEVDALTKRLGNRPPADRRADIADIVRENGFKLWNSDWGYCVFAPEGAKCHRKNNVLGTWARRAPNLADRSPPRCVECPHFAVAPEHEPFWRQRLKENREKLEACKNDQKTTPVIAAQFRERVRQAEIVLTWIEKENHHAA